MFVIGLTGGIASGKTTIAAMLTARGAHLVDADKVGHRVLLLPEVKAELVETFGGEVIGEDGEVNRRVLGGLVFSSPENLAKLNAISHPRLRRLAREEIEEVRAAGGFEVLVLDAAILFEAGWDKICDENWVVYAPEEIAVDRLFTRNGLTPEQARARIASQMPIEQKRQRADVLILNTRPLPEVEETVDREYQKLLARVRGEAPRLRPPAEADVL